MNNFQLYRTNHLLSGQLKWDIIVNSASNQLYVSDFHLTPISPNISYVYKSDEYLIKNSHQENVKAFYTENKGSFYDEALGSEFTHSWPLICKNNEKLDNYSNIYDYGCRRTDSYEKYGKQFEFLCPLWIEHLNGSLSFKISIKNSESDMLIGARTLTFDYNGEAFHDNFVKYYNNYIDYTRISDGNSDVLNVLFKDKMASITGINASTGLFETHQINSLIDNLTSRERPLVESDSLLTYSFCNNNMICAQLFNFNLCFNIDDIVSNRIMKMLAANNIKITIDTYIGDELLEKRDFYTEYDNINKEVHVENGEPYSDNVLNYLYDYRCVDLIDRNKFCQSICHWSLNDNLDYMFNVYDGFGGIYKDGDNIYENSHQYGFAPNIDIRDHNKSQNNIGWINIVTLASWNDFNLYLENMEKYRENGLHINNEITFMNGLKYSEIPEELNDTYLIGMIVTDSLLISINATFKNDKTFYVLHDDESSVFIMKHDNLIFVITNDINNMTFKRFYTLLNLSDKSSDIVMSLYKLMSNAIAPSLIIFNGSIRYINASSPSIDSNEISYVRDNAYHNHVFRYDGKIKPMFTKTNSTLYYKDYVSDEKPDSKFKKTPYYKYGNMYYEPLYPSIGYCAIKNISDWDYDHIPMITVSEFNNPINITAPHEYTWFNTNNYIILIPELHFTYINTKDGGYKTMNEILFEFIGEYYKTNDMSKIAYIFNLYEYTNTWEYYSETNVDDYIYNIKLKLK